MIENIHKVGARVWTRWGERAQAVFNETYDFLRDNQWACKHPKTAPLPQEEWDTLAWNAAWTAAHIASQHKG